MADQILHIHGVPIFGECLFEESLAKIKEITDKKLWQGIKGLYFSSRKVEAENYINTGGYTYFTTSRTYNYPNPQTVYYKDGKQHVVTAMTPYIYVESGIFPDDYWFAQTVLHEVGHHNEKPFLDDYNREVAAHLFSLKYLYHFKYKELMKPHPRHWFDAVKIHEESNKR